MPELDNLLSKSLVLTIKENLGEKALQKIEKRIFEKYGVNLTQSLHDFPKLDSVLRDFFGNGAEGLEKQILRKTITIEEAVKEEPSWLLLESKSLSKTVLGAFADPDKNCIMNSVLKESRIISEILEVCKISRISGYDKVDSLIGEGLLVPDGYVTLHDGKEVTRYRTMFENMKIDIENNKVTVKVKILDKFLEKSSIMQVISR